MAGRITLPDLEGLEDFPIYTSVSTSASSADRPVQQLPLAPHQFSASNLTGSLSQSTKWPLDVCRFWASADDALGGLLLTFTIRNRDTFHSVELGAVGLPMVFQGRWDNMLLEKMAREAYFLDFYTGMHHGYALLKRLDGRGPCLLLLPEHGSALQATRLAREDRAAAMALGTPEWMVHSRAYQDAEWSASGGPWNSATSAVLRPNETLTLGLRLLPLDNVRKVDELLLAAGRAVVRGVPGYVCVAGLHSMRLYVHPPAGACVEGVSVEPPGRLAVGQQMRPEGSPETVLPLSCTGAEPGRVRLVIAYSDGSLQTVHYYVLPDLAQHVDTFGTFQADNAWLPRSFPDPFGRAASFMPWDRDERRHVLHDPRAFVVGLSDEAGAGANVAMAVKTQRRPAAREAALLSQYVEDTLWGAKPEWPLSRPLQHNVTGGVRAGLFWVPDPPGSPGMPNFTYEPEDLVGWLWGYGRSVGSFGRAYNYPHQTAVYLALHRIARDCHQCGAVLARSADWYLGQAMLTVRGMWRVARWYCQSGLMVGTVFRDLLLDLRVARRYDDADELLDMMRNRTEVGLRFPGPPTCPAGAAYCRCEAQPPGSQPPTWLVCPSWREHPFPFGSEFAFDTTGYEEVYVWGRFFGANDTAQAALDSITSFVPVMPHWLYHGSAWGWGDFSNNAKITPWGGFERVMHHYRAGLNAIPLLEEYAAHPSDQWLLSAFMGAALGGMANIDAEGAASMAFHEDPSVLQYDPYSGDFGIGFFGTARLMGSYLTQRTGRVEMGGGPASRQGFADVELGGWTCWLCDAQLLPSPGFHPLAPPHTLHVQSRGAHTGAGYSYEGGSALRVWPRDAFRQRVFVAPLALLLEVQSGTITSFVLDVAAGIMQVDLAPYATWPLAQYRLQLRQTSADVAQLQWLKICSTSLFVGEGMYIVQSLTGEAMSAATAVVCWG